jgi:hypothetical protein
MSKVPENTQQLMIIKTFLGNIPDQYPSHLPLPPTVRFNKYLVCLNESLYGKKYFLSE